MSRKRFIFKDGKFVPVEGKGMTVLPDHLRKLPSEFVTTDIDDPDKIHELDPGHIITDMLPTLEKKYLGKTDKRDIMVMARAERMEKAFQLIPPGEKAPITQPRVDALRFKTINSLIQSAYDAMKAGEDVGPYLKVRHLWFPEKDNVNNVQLRFGNPPSDYGRPKWMRGLDIVIDITDWPPVVKDRLAEYGLKMPTLADMQEKLLREREDDERPAARLNQ